MTTLLGDSASWSHLLFFSFFFPQGFREYFPLFQETDRFFARGFRSAIRVCFIFYCFQEEESYKVILEGLQLLPFLREKSSHQQRTKNAWAMFVQLFSIIVTHPVPLRIAREKSGTMKIGFHYLPRLIVGGGPLKGTRGRGAHTRLARSYVSSTCKCQWRLKIGRFARWNRLSTISSKSRSDPRGFGGRILEEEGDALLEICESRFWKMAFHPLLKFERDDRVFSRSSLQPASK